MEVRRMDETVPAKLNLRAKLLAVMGDVFGVAKRGQNTQGGTYTYQKAADIFPKVQRALREHGVTFMAHELGTEWLPTHESRSGGTIFVVIVKMQYRFLDTESDEVLAGDSSGLAFDSSDKGINKAKTAALKYFLKQTLLLAEEDDDSEVETLETAPAKRLAVKPETAHQAPQPENMEGDPFTSFQASTDARITDAQALNITQWCRANSADFLGVFGEKFSVAKPEEMTQPQFDIWQKTRDVILKQYQGQHQRLDQAEALVNGAAGRIQRGA